MSKNKPTISQKTEDGMVNLDTFMRKVVALARQHNVMCCVMGYAEGGAAGAYWNIDTDFSSIVVCDHCTQLHLDGPDPEKPTISFNRFNESAQATVAFKGLFDKEHENIGQLYDHFMDILDTTGLPIEVSVHTVDEKGLNTMKQKKFN